jgi:hypothetical protein
VARPTGTFSGASSSPGNTSAGSKNRSVSTPRPDFIVIAYAIDGRMGLWQAKHT